MKRGVRQQMVIGRRSDWWIWSIFGVLLIGFGILFPRTAYPDRELWGRLTLVTIGLGPFLAGILLWLRRSYVILDAAARTATHGWTLLGRTRLAVREVTRDDQVTLTRQTEGPRSREVDFFHVTLDGSNDPLPLAKKQSLGEAHALAERVARFLQLPMADYTHGELSRRTPRALDVPFAERVRLKRRGGQWQIVPSATNLPDLPANSMLRVRKTESGLVFRLGPNHLGPGGIGALFMVTLLLAAVIWWFVGADFGGRVAACMVAFVLLAIVVHIATENGRVETVSIEPDEVTVMRKLGRRRTTIWLSPQEIEDVLLGLDGEFVVLRTDAGSVLLGRGIWMDSADMLRLRGALRAALRIITSDT